MKPSIHPEYQAARIVCACGNIIETRSFFFRLDFIPVYTDLEGANVEFDHTSHLGGDETAAREPALRVVDLRRGLGDPLRSDARIGEQRGQLLPGHVDELRPQASSPEDRVERVDRDPGEAGRRQGRDRKSVV